MLPAKSIIGRARVVVEDAALIGAPQQLRPAGAGRKGVAAHEPAVAGDGRVVQQVGLDDPVELLVRMMRGDALVEARCRSSCCSSAARFRHRTAVVHPATSPQFRIDGRWFQ